MPWADRVLETSTSTGATDFTLAGAVTGYRTFASVFDNNLMLKYCIEAVDGDGVPTGEWEVGRSWITGGTNLVRNGSQVVESSSNSGNPVTFSAGTKNVFNQFGALGARQAQIAFGLQYGMP